MCQWNYACCSHVAGNLCRDKLKYISRQLYFNVSHYGLFQRQYSVLNSTSSIQIRGSYEQEFDLIFANKIK